MLLQFSVSNYRSIKDTITFSMLASAKHENSFKIKKYNLLNSAVIYGANASGKSNLLRAMAFMRRIVLNKTKVFQSTDTLPHDPFRLNSSTKDASSTFEIVFFIDEIKYRYGFELDNTTVYAEWLYADEKGKEAKLFYRDSEDENYVNLQKFKEGKKFFDEKKLEIDVLPNQLFIWECDRTKDGVISKSILKWFNSFNLIDGLDHRGYVNYTMNKMEDESFKKEIVNLVKTADIGIEDIDVNKEEISKEFFEKSPFTDDFINDLIESGNNKIPIIKTIHTMYNEDNIAILDENGKVKKEIFELDNEESVGTQKFFKMSAPILNTLQKGKILIIDELDASLHPMLTKHLIKLFSDKDINTKNAQLIFATHDTNLLKPQIFKRDQIWFTEKDKYGSTTLYSILEIKGVRADHDFEKQYIQGKYGAVPYLGKFEF